MLQPSIDRPPNGTNNAFTRSTAQILPAFRPKTAAAPLANHSDISAMLSQSKMVDFALLLMPPSDSPLNKTMKQLFCSLPPDMRAVSQSAYGPLRSYPAPVAIKTKANNGDTEEAKVQLGVWTAAWFARMRELLRFSNGATGRGTIAVPLLIVESAQWSLYYACENDYTIVSTSLFYFCLFIFFRSVLTLLSTRIYTGQIF